MTDSTRKKVFHYVAQCIAAGQSPTVREVQHQFAFKSSGTAREHLDRLIAEGALEKVPGVARGYRLRQGGGPFPPLRLAPIVGTVQAGSPVLAVENIDGYIAVAGPGPDEDFFALKVRGDSMQRAGILPDDLVVVRQQRTAENGDIVVALIEDEATVKRLVRRGDRCELHPESDNPVHRPLCFPPELLSILGKVVEVRRYL